MFTIKTYNTIAPKGLAVFGEEYVVDAGATAPDAIVLRSHVLRADDVPESVLIVGRAGAGVNNIPVDALTERGVVVCNAPGANANAVAELVIASLLSVYRNVCEARAHMAAMEESGDALTEAVERAKKAFVGAEVRGKTIGVIGLGAIGVRVANAACVLGMRAVGYDPHLSVRNALALSSAVERVHRADEVFARADCITAHVPLTDATRHMIDDAALGRMKRGVVLLNFARAGVFDDEAVVRALDEGRVARYVSDFPSRKLIEHEKVVCVPHLGASTAQAEEASGVMVARQIVDYLENGNIENAVNFPAVSLARAGETRLALVHENRADMLGCVTRLLGKSGINIVHMVNENAGTIAYTLLDTEASVPESTLGDMRAIEGMIRVRAL